MNPERAARFLGATELFEGLDPTTLQHVAERCVDRTYKKGQLIFHQGDPGTTLFLVVEGLVKVLVPSIEGGEMVLVTVAPPETFGEIALVDGGTRSASAEAAEETRVIALQRTTMLELLEEHPELTDALLTSLGKIIRRLTEQTSDLVFLDLHGRVAKLLMRLAEEGGEETPDGIVLDLHLTQTDLASMVGGSRQSVNQILRAFEGRGYLEVTGRTIVIKQPDVLRRRAGVAVG
jgi:CRP-like cAMP-binding protein